MANRRVVVTGLGAVTPYGIGAQKFWDNISGGHTGASLITSFDVSTLPTKFAAQVQCPDGVLTSQVDNQKALKTMSRAATFAVVAAKEAVNDAGIPLANIDPYRLGTSMGVGGLGLTDLDHTVQMTLIACDSIKMSKDQSKPDFSKIWENSLEKTNPLTPLKSLANITTAHIAINHNARGVCQTVATACTSSAQAIGEAYHQIRQDIADVIIAGGCDSMINPNGLIAFSALGILSKNNQEYLTAARPFDRRRDGFMLGEGSAIIILEELDHCRKRGGQPYGEIIGYASTCDAYRITDEPPQAWGSTQSMRLALKEAQLHPDQIDYVNAHGTGTQMNDKTETYAIKSVFRERAYLLPVSSTKSMIGHLVAAAGAVEFTACILAMKNQIIPPTINYLEPDPECDLDYVPNEAREAQLDVILSNSFGFGGQNACLILQKIY